MAEIRINATGGVKLYDADDSHYAQIVAGTITSNVDAITLGHDTVTIADNLSLGSDSAVLKFGADGDTTLTHTDGTGLTLNSTNKLCFNDASQYIQGASNAILDIAATDEIELNATLVDINANVEISGTATTTGVHTFSATPVFPDGSLALADLDIDGGTDIGAAIVDADLFIIDDGAGGTNRKTAASRLKTYIGDNTPAFDAYMNSAQSVSDNAVTKVSIDTEIFDSDGAYDHSTNYRFTPGVAGKYYVYGSILGQTDASKLKNIVVIIYKNGSVYRTSNHDPRDNFGNEASVMVSAIIDMDADDYVELYGQCNADNDTNTVFAVTHTRPCYFGAFKVLGA